MLLPRSFLVGLLATAALAGQLEAQGTGTIRGRVVAAGTQQALALVRVAVADRTTETDSDGQFVFTTMPAGTYTLRTNMLGYRQSVDTVTVVAGQTANVQITMQAMALSLEALVVTGYGQQERRDLTGVVDEVPSETFNTGRIVQPEELIKAKVAGVEVAESNGGEPGGGMSIRIRGGTSVTSSNEPLYVIDGVPMPVGGGLSAGRSPLNFINPNDIESFTVLKDASATAIYGSQGANGVIMITTKSGKGAATTGWDLTYRGTLSGSVVAAQPSMLSAAEFRQVVQEQASDLVGYLGSATTDWNKEVQQSAFGQEHTVVVAGGSGGSSLRASFGYLSQDGIVQASTNERMSLNVAFNQRLFDDRLSLQANVMGARNADRFTPGGVLGNANNFAPTQPVLEEGSPYGGYFEWDATRTAVNPVAELNRQTDEGTTYRSIGNLTAEYALPFVEGLSATARVGYLVTSSERRFFAPSTDKSQINRGLYGTVSRSNPTEVGSLFDGYLTYDRTFDRHSFNLTAGYAYQWRRQDSPSFYAQDLSSDLLGPNGVPSAELQQTSLYVDESKLASYFARANYSLMDRYLLTASVRTVGSSKFGAWNHWGTFPSAAVAWRLSEEPFLYGAGFLSDLKLRLSWGKNGNQAFPSYSQYKQYVYGDPQAQVQFGNEFVPTIRPSAADPNIRWEETSSWNLGIDYGFWSNRVFGTLEFYTKETKDLIFDVIVAAGTNLSNSVITNIGTMRNKGFELTVNAGLFEGGRSGFSWDANFNFAYNKNTLKYINPFAGGAEQLLWGPFISGGVGTQVQVLRPEYPVNSFFVLQHKLDANGKPIVGTDLEMYVDRNNDGKIDQDDRAPYRVTYNDAGEAVDTVGLKARPDWIIGHTSLMRFKNFDLSLTFLAQLGAYMYNNVASSTGFYDQLRNSDRPNNLHSSVLEYGFTTPQYQSDIYVEDASFLRLQNIELGYTFGGLLNGMRLFGVVQNVFTITGYSGIDPTSTISGIDNNIYPRSRTFTAGLSVTF